MVDLMSLSVEFMTNTVVMVTEPLAFVKLVFMFGLRTIFLVTHIWLQLVRGIINFNVGLCWSVIIWMYAFVSLPVRILNALQRERLIEMHLHELHVELENLAWDKKELDEQLQITLKDCRIMGSVISELEEENDKAIARIELLENELQDLKEENIQLAGLEGNGNKNVTDNGRQDNLATDYDNRSVYIGKEEIIRDFLSQKKTWEDETKNRALPRGTTPKGPVVDLALHQYREVAFSRSLFSAVLSILVGVIVWQAKDPCTPLVLALFTVVSMSLWSVVQFFSTIKNRPASDAVALLSFNWFILGTLAYPTLPMVGHVFAPLQQSVAGRMIQWLGITSLLS